jgi:hypothetical protein
MFSAQKTSTQQFTEIEDIIDRVVFLKGGNACSVIEITASNFALLSKRDQDTKIYSYAAFLNSLTFPVQILIRNKRVDITSYLQLLEDQESKTTNPLLIRNIRLYSEFVHEMVKINVVLNKAFYVILTYSSLEAGIGGSMPGSKNMSQKDIHITQATKGLLTKAESLQGQLRRFAMSTKLLDKKELVKLFYDIFNENTEGEFDATHIEEDIKSVFVKPTKAV